MDATRSSTSSSRAHPGRGALLALALLGTYAALGPSRPERRPPEAEPLKPFLTAPGPLGGDPQPEVLVVGDSRVFQLRFEPLLQGLGRPATGRVWGEGGGTVPDMLAHLEAQGIRPGLLVVGVSPNSVAIQSWMRAFRTGREEEVRLPLRLKRWTRETLLRPLSFLPRDRGPELLAAWALPALRTAGWRGVEEEWLNLPPPNTPGYRQLYTEAEKAPSEKAVSATIEVLRRARASGSRIVLVRLPVGPELLALEDAWGADGVIGRIAREAGAPLVDFHRLEAYESLKPAIFDGSHVYGEAPTREMSEALGREIRKIEDEVGAAGGPVGQEPRGRGLR